MNVLSIHSHVAYGHVGNSAAVFPLQRLGIEVWPIHTLQFSNHLGYDNATGQVFRADHVRDVIDGIQALGALASCDAVLTGYLGTTDLGEAALAAVERVRRANPKAVYACDPVMGDDGGGLYVHEDIPAFFRGRGLALADIITPNRFELELLSGRRITTLEEAITAARSVSALGPRIVLVTSLRHTATASDTIEILAATGEAAWRVHTPYLEFPIAPNGGGDAIAALFLAHYLKSQDCASALEAAAAATYGIMAATHAAGTRELQLIAAQDELVRPSHRFTAEKIA